MEIDGKKVIDAKKNLELHVLKKDCDKAAKNGGQKDPGACAAVVALQRENPDVLRARVHRGVTYLEYENFWLRYKTSAALAFELSAFDRASTVEGAAASFMPGVYGLKAPAKLSIALVNMGSRTRDTDKRTRHDKNGKRLPRHEITHIRPRGANR